MPTLLESIANPTDYGILITVTVLGAIYLLLYRWQLVKNHPDEPPIIPSAIPFLGHPLRMALQGGRYVKNLG